MKQFNLPTSIKAALGNDIKTMNKGFWFAHR